MGVYEGLTNLFVWEAPYTLVKTLYVGETRFWLILAFD